MDVDRLLPGEEAEALLDLATTLAERELRPRADEAEAAGAFPRDLVTTLGRSGSSICRRRSCCSWCRASCSASGPRR
jgi:hypothetical protein